MSCPYFYSCMLHKLLSHLVVFFFFISSSTFMIHMQVMKKKSSFNCVYNNKNTERFRHKKGSSGFGFYNQNSAGHFTRRSPTHQVIAVGSIVLSPHPLTPRVVTIRSLWANQRARLLSVPAPQFQHLLHGQRPDGTELLPLHEEINA